MNKANYMLVSVKFAIKHMTREMSTMIHPKNIRPSWIMYQVIARFKGNELYGIERRPQSATLEERRMMEDSMTTCTFPGPG